MKLERWFDSPYKEEAKAKGDWLSRDRCRVCCSWRILFNVAEIEAERALGNEGIAAGAT